MNAITTECNVEGTNSDAIAAALQVPVGILTTDELSIDPPEMYAGVWMFDTGYVSAYAVLMLAVTSELRQRHTKPTCPSRLW